MNIHFTDKILFEKLKEATLAKVKVGSFLYGNNNENSDEDFLYIYATSENELNSFVQTNHQLQYKEEGIDHNFVSLHTFIRNIINGDSTINYEVVHSDELIETDLQWLSNLKDYFNTYTIKRSYNGLARRDCKHFTKGVTDYEKQKRLGHIIRGHIYCYMIGKDFDFKKANILFINTINQIKKDNCVNMDMIKTYIAKIELQRTLLNKSLEDKTLGLAKHIDFNNGVILNKTLTSFMNIDLFKEKQAHLYNFNMEIFINAFENWVEY